MNVYLWSTDVWSLLWSTWMDGIYLGTDEVYKESSKVIIVNDDFTTATNAQLTAEWWLSVGDSYWLDTSTNWLHWHTFETDTASWVEFQVTDSLVWKKFCWELEWYRWIIDRWWNISFSLDRPANYSNKRKKYDIVASCAWWGIGLRSLPGEWQWGWSYQYAWVSNGAMGFRNWTSSSNIDMYWDKWNKWLYWQPYNSNYSLDLPFTLWIYKWRWYADFGNWITHIEWESPDWTIKTFERNFTSDSQSSKDSLNDWLAWKNKYIRLTSNRWYWSGSDYDKDYWRKAKIWYE